MITYIWWKRLFEDSFWDILDYLFASILTPVTLVLDILLVPFEIVALIIWKVRNR